jgi:hypothetical protein
VAVIQAAQSAVPDVPAPSGRWLKASKEAWVDFWTSTVAGVVTTADMPGLLRLFEHRDLQARALSRYRRKPYVNGSTGQPVTNPAFGEAMKLESAAVALEDRLGLSPKARAALGIVFGQAAMTAADLNKMAAEETGDGFDADDVLEVDGWEAD